MASVSQLPERRTYHDGIADGVRRVRGRLPFHGDHLKLILGVLLTANLLLMGAVVVMNLRWPDPVTVQPVPQQPPSIVKPGKRTKAKGPVEPVVDGKAGNESTKRNSSEAKQKAPTTHKGAAGAVVAGVDEARKRTNPAPTVKRTPEVGQKTPVVVVPKFTEKPRPSSTPKPSPSVKATAKPTPTPAPTATPRPSPVRELVGDVVGVVGKIL